MRVATFLLLAFAATAAHATWGIKPSMLEVRAGTTYETRVSFLSGVVIYPAHWFFESDDPSVAQISGEFDSSTANRNVVTIRAIAPGVARVRIVGTTTYLATVHVIESGTPPELVPIPSLNPHVPTETDAFVQVVAPKDEALTCTWYSGHAGDITTPLSGACHYIFAAKQYAGTYFVWVRATATSGTALMEFAITVEAPRKRRAQH